MKLVNIMSVVSLEDTGYTEEQYTQSREGATT